MAGGVERRLVAPFGAAEDQARRNALAVVARAGVELLETVRIRGDGRGVLIVRRPDGEICVLKTTFAARDAAGGLANLGLARLVAETTPWIFPTVREATADYTLEAFIEGRRLREWMNAAFEPGPVEAYFLELRRWSEGPGPWSGSDLLKPHEIQALVSAYIGKCIGHHRFLAPDAALRAVGRLRGDRGGIAEKIRWLARSAERIEIPRGMMCGDMGNVNLIVERGTDRIYNIDYEFMGPGHRGFDCAYLISALAKMDADPDALAHIRWFALSEEYLGSKACAEFFAVYADVLAAIGREIHRQA